MAHLKDIRPEPVKIELGGKERIIKYDLNAFAELEKRFGSVEIAMTDLQKGSLASIKMILWVGLIHEEATIDEFTGDVISYGITPYQVGGWITPSMLPMVSEKLGEAITDGSPEVKTVMGVENNDSPDIDTSKMAKVVLTEEEKKKEAEELKND